LNKYLIIQIQQQNADLLQINSEQAGMIVNLQERIAEWENNQKKNSSNSSMPSGSDIGRPKQTQSLRTSSGKNPGGQTGHSGETLSFSLTSDEIVTHIVSQCACCAKNISGVDAYNHERKGV